MPAYVIAEVEITEPKTFQEYAKRVPGTIAAYGGKYLVRGGATKVKEGDWSPKRLVILEFASMNQARNWYDSPEYKPLLELRLRSATTKVLFVEGL